MNRQNNRNTARPFGIVMDCLNTEEFIQQTIHWAREKSQPRLIVYLNAHCINLYFRDDVYARIVDAADCVYADGQAVVWASTFLGQPLPERVNAGDFLEAFCERCAEENLSIYFLGSAAGVAEKAAENLKKNCPAMKVAGCHSGYFKPDEAEALVQKIKETHPDILLIGMGVPLQEKFAAARLSELAAPVIWCVGALFEYYAGVTPRAPRWMRTCGLEWLFRLIVEPRRMWRRYILGNAAFLIKTVRFRFGKPPSPKVKP